MQPPSKRLKLADVPNYVAHATGRTVTKMTVYNWVHKGVSGEKLRIVLARGESKYAGLFRQTRFTTVAWVDEFMARVGQSAA